MAGSTHTYIRRVERRVRTINIWLLETLYYEKLDCQAGLGQIPEAKREMKRILKKHPRLSTMRPLQSILENESYRKPEVYALVTNET